MLRFDVITIFPKMLDSYLAEGILARAIGEKRIAVAAHDLRTWAADRHRSVDDSPYGGGAGMVMKVEPIWKAVRALTKGRKSAKTRIVLFSAKGKPFTQQVAHRFAKYSRLIFICGRYEGVDERVAAHIADEEISVGPYVLTGGELPALTVIDAVSRLLPGVLGNAASLAEESHGGRIGEGEYPQYTRPDAFSPKRGTTWRVPKVLLSGDHGAVADWRKTNIS